jgi:hypothetical protein
MAYLNDIPAILRRAIKTGVNVHLTGEPGIGKTAVIEQVVAEEKKADPEFWYGNVYTPSLTPTDFVCMMPDPATNLLRPYRHERLPNGFTHPGLRGMLFLGERDNADPATNKALQKYINNEDMGGLIKPKGVIVVSDSNDVSHRSGAVQQSLALLSRSVHINVELDPNVTIKYFADVGVHPLVQAYLSLRKEHVSTFANVISKREYRVWANPRAWERLASMIEAAEAEGEQVTLDEIIGNVGEAVGREFSAFMYAATQLVSYGGIVADPLKAHVPEKLSEVYAVIAMLSASVRAADFPNVRKYVERFSTEVQVLFLRLLASSKGSHVSACTKTSAYTEWFAVEAIRQAVLG